MNNSTIPLELWGHWGAPNPFKVVTILEALRLPYNTHLLELSEVKQESYIKLNPNGRLPTLKDPNTDVTLFEVCVQNVNRRLIVMLTQSSLVLSYNTSSTSMTRGEIFPTTRWSRNTKLSNGLRFRSQVWILLFDVMSSSRDTGQGPYYGQATWFARFHPEKMPSAIDRYVNEIERVMGVLELGLETNGTGWLVGDKCTFADLSFVTWNSVGEGLLAELGRSEGVDVKFPRYAAWNKRMEERGEVRTVRERMAKGRAQHGLK